jgi:hypothetical protein
VVAGARPGAGVCAARVQPPEALAEKPRNGSIDRELSFPVEDIYIRCQPAGQGGQEIYGAGAAFIFASRSFHRLEGAPFDLFCDSFVFAWDRPTARFALLTLAGSPQAEAMLALTPLDGRREPVLNFADGRQCKGRQQDGALFFRVPADASLRLTW